jgi:hypothetical protein
MFAGLYIDKQQDCKKAAGTINRPFVVEQIWCPGYWEYRLRKCGTGAVSGREQLLVVMQFTGRTGN